MRHVCSSSVRRFVGVVSAVAVWIFAGTLGSVAHAGDVVISQIYGGGGVNSGSLRNDYVELFNRSADPVSLSGWCLQYAPAMGFFRLDNNQTIALDGAIPAGGYYLVRLGGGSAGTRDLPVPDAVGLIDIDAVNGQLVLLNSCTERFADSEYLSGGRAVDFVGYGTTAWRFEGGGPSVPGTNSTAVLRAQAGCHEVDDNDVDFSRATPTPRNSISLPRSCANFNAPIVTICPKTMFVLPFGAGGTQWISARDPDGMVSTASITPRPNITASAFVPATESGAAGAGQLTFGTALAAGNYSVVVSFINNDPTPQTASCTITFKVAATTGTPRISYIQGLSHISPHLDQVVNLVPGIVTAVRFNGFFMQDPVRDTYTASSEGIFVVTDSAPTVRVGDSVRVTGRVEEFRPGGSEGANNLTTTRIVASRIDVLSSGNTLPPPILVSVRERMPPPAIIDNDSNVSPETSERFDADSDGIDFYESLEGMRVRIEDVVAVGPTRNHETPVLMDHHRPGSEGKRTSRGGVFVLPDDFNPERMILVDELAPVPSVNVGALAPSATGVIDYSSGNFKLLVTGGAAFTDSALESEVTNPPSLGWPEAWLAVASFNVGNLHFGAAPERFTAIARQIVTNLRAPDVVALLEVQDSNGPDDDSVVDASPTYQQLIDTIVSWGGPTYQYRQIDPIDDQDGGEAGGNSRIGYLFNPQTVTFVDRPGGTATAATSVFAGPYGPELSASPARIDPQNAAFAASQKPLAAEILFNGYKLFLVANQFVSRAGDPPLFGRLQPPLSRSEAQRIRQATVVSEFVQGLRAADPEARVVVFGGFNDFADSATKQILQGAGLVSLVNGVTLRDRYTQIVDGNSLAFDDILISQSLISGTMPEFDIVHVNSEFHSAGSYYDPVLAKLLLPRRDADLNLELGEFVFDEATGRYVGTMRVTNLNNPTLRGPFQVQLSNLPPGESVVNPSGYLHGVPFVTVPVASLASGESVDVPVEFTVSPESFALVWYILMGEY